MREKGEEVIDREIFQGRGEIKDNDQNGCRGLNKERWYVDKRMTRLLSNFI